MLYPKNLEQKLGFDKIREILKSLCVSILGQEYVDKIRFSDDHDLIKKLTNQTNDFRKIILFEETFPSQNYIDAKPALQKAQVLGNFLNEQDFFEIKISLNTISDCITFLSQRATMYPTLAEITQMASLDKAIVQKIDAVIDERAKLRNNASVELQRIRKEISTQNNQLRKQTDTILRNAKKQGWIDSEANLTIRGGRIVIPIPAEHKRKIKGFVHDESATGQTVYLEPTEILEMNNEIRELESMERREIVRILTQLTDELRPHIPALWRCYQFLGMIDFIRAKAKFALQIEAEMPIFRQKPILKWTQAYHPLLWITHKEQQKKVVPLSIQLDDNQRIIVVSGPNAGGKSVSLKTVGLLQYMWQSGLLVSMKDFSEIGIFKNIFIDIGDEQSLENDLSTYSSHLTNMRQFVNYADKNTLFLIDEFGTGTEPRLGGAIAEAILEELHEKNAFGVVNTHYGNLKVLAEKSKNIENAAMRFDVQNLEPMYVLEIGQAGSSFAFEIAQKIGLPKKILAKAKEKLDTNEVNYDKLLKQLEQDKKILDEKNQFLTRQQKEYQTLLDKYNEMNGYLETEKKKILNEAKQKAKKLVEDANQKIELTIREIRENQADKQKTKDIRKKLETFETKDLILEEVEIEPSDEIEVLSGEIKVGDAVRIKGQATLGEVLALRGKDAEISIGDLKSTLKISRLEKISRKILKKEKKEIRKSHGINLAEKSANFTFSLDIRGMRGENAVLELDKFLDNAILVGYNELRLLHGKGDGILRKLLREHLKTYKQVASFADEHADRGGAGITIVKMK
jgi:DNA mismatch repair protein MutS2